MITPREQTFAILAFAHIDPIGVTPAQRAREAALMLVGAADRQPDEIARIQREILRIGAQ